MNRITTRLILAIAISAMALFLTDCHKNHDDPTPAAQAPTITSFNPTSGKEGDAVTISGTNFSATGATISFAGTAATISSATETQIITTVPVGAASGKITVKVGELTATSSVDFTLLHPAVIPAVASFLPTSGTVSTSIVITGTDFSTTPASNTVKINNVAATVTAATATQLTVKVAEGTRTGKITVTVNGQTGTSTTDFTINPPTITSFSPASATQGSTIVVTGTNFSTVKAEDTVKFETFSAVVTDVTATTITTSVPANFLGGKINVMVNGLKVTSATSLDVPLPTVTSMEPLHGLPGSEVVINGTGFGSLPDAAKITMKAVGRLDIPLTIKTITDTRITFTLPVQEYPNGYLGNVDVAIGYWAPATTPEAFEPLADFPRNGLVAFYPFFGDATDGSGNGLNGSLQNQNGDNGPGLTNDRWEQANQAYSFDGSGDYIRVANAAPLHISGNMTIAMWVNMPTEVTDDKTLINKHTGTGTDGCNGYDLQLVHTATNTYELAASTKEATEYFTNNFTQSNGTWQFIVFSISGGTAKTYVSQYSTNPQPLSPVTNSSADPLFDCDADLLIGGPNNWINVNVHHEPFEGMIDDVMIYNRVLSDDEVQKVYVQTITKYL